MTDRPRRERDRLYEAGLCVLCTRPVTEKGQRGPRWAHSACRRLRDAGTPVADIRRLMANPWVGVEAFAAGMVPPDVMVYRAADLEPCATAHADLVAAVDKLTAALRRLIDDAAAAIAKDRP